VRGAFFVPFIALTLFACATKQTNNGSLTDIKPLFPPRATFYPAAFQDDIWINMAAFTEPKFDAAEASNNHKRRYRLSFSGIACTEYVIRLDERTDGRISGVVKTRVRCGRGRSTLDKAVPVIVRKFSAKATNLDSIDTAMADATMFKYYPEFWIDKDLDAMCLDGIQLVFERRNNAGFGISTSNAQCTTPPAVRAIAVKFIDISGAKKAMGLLQ
jgi:hypothetical protein